MIAFTTRRGLRIRYTVTEGTAHWTYACRQCPFTYSWDASAGAFRYLPVELQRAIRDHALLHPQEQP